MGYEIRKITNDSVNPLDAGWFEVLPPMFGTGDLT